MHYIIITRCTMQMQCYCCDWQVSLPSIFPLCLLLTDGQLSFHALEVFKANLYNS